MAERKVQSKHIPADFDHRVLKHLKSKEPKQKKLKSATGGGAKNTVRLMLPFNVCCANCNCYMYRGRKFNARKEISDQDYLGTKLLHFHIKCEYCSAPLVFRTDPESSGFAMVSGGRENLTSAGRFNPLAGVVEQDENKEELDALAALEAQALETQREMEKLNELSKEMHRSAQREANLKSGLVLPSDLSLEEKIEEDELLDEFRLKKRQLGFIQTEAPAIKIDSVVPQEPEDNGVVFQIRKRSKPLDVSKAVNLVPTTTTTTTASAFVGYSDSDEE